MYKINLNGGVGCSGFLWMINKTVTKMFAFLRNNCEYCNVK